MKKLIFLFIPLLWSCQKYVQPSNPQLNVNGEWRIVSVLSTYESTVASSIQVVNSDFYALSPFKVVTFDSTAGLMRITNDTTNIRPCFFYKTGYVWEFDYNNLILKNSSGNILKSYHVWFGDPYYNPNDFKITDILTGESIPGNWHLSQNGNGAMPANDLYVDVPEIWFDINGSQRSYVRAINQKLTVRFTR